MLLLATIAGALIGCGGTTNAEKTPANPGTTLGTYSVTVIGTSGATVPSPAVTVNVTVNLSKTHELRFCSKLPAFLVLEI